MHCTVPDQTAEFLSLHVLRLLAGGAVSNYITFENITLVS